jgi:hypothetical protein
MVPNAAAVTAAILKDFNMLPSLTLASNWKHPTPAKTLH